MAYRDAAQTSLDSFLFASICYLRCKKAWKLTHKIHDLQEEFGRCQRKSKEKSIKVEEGLGESGASPNDGL